MDVIRLKNGNEYSISEGATLPRNVHQAASAEAAEAFIGDLTDENVSDVQFLEDGVMYGHFVGLSLQYATIDGNVVTFGLEET